MGHQGRDDLFCSGLLIRTNIELHVSHSHAQQIEGHVLIVTAEFDLVLSFKLQNRALDWELHQLLNHGEDRKISQEIPMLHNHHPQQAN